MSVSASASVRVSVCHLVCLDDLALFAQAHLVCTCASEGLALGCMCECEYMCVCACEGLALGCMCERVYMCVCASVCVYIGANVCMCECLCARV